MLREDNATEPPLRRHMRHWTARFTGSLTVAAIVGMGINHSFSEIDNYGMIVRLTPRPHSILGARFSLESCSILPMDEFKEITTMIGMEKVLVQHERERNMLKERTRGQQDFIACFVMTANEGRYKLEGDGHGTEVRFKPLGLSRDAARSPQFKDPSIAWLQTLQYQVENDVPTRLVV